MKICVTGASGLIGEALVSQLAKLQGVQVFGVTRRPINRDLQGVTWLTADLRDVAQCNAIMSDFDVIVHLAWRSLPLAGGASSVEDVQNNLIPTLNLLETVQRSGHRPHLVLCSSGGTVYGRSKTRRPFLETDACNPIGLYATLKLAAENFCQSFASAGHIGLTVLRVSTVYGRLLSKDAMQGFIGTALTRALAGEPVRLIGDPENVRDYVHIDDVVDAIIAAANRPLDNANVVNIGSGVGTSVLDAIQVIESVVGRPVDVYHETRINPYALVDWSVLDIEKARSDLGWSPKIDLRDGVRRMLPDNRQ